MSIKEDMFNATTFPMKQCAKCSGHLTVKEKDLAQAGLDTDATDQAKFDELVTLAGQGASAKCDGCTVNTSGEWDAEKKIGKIKASGADPNSHQPDPGNLI